MRDYKRGYCRLAFCRDLGIGTEELKEILDLLPEDSVVVGFGESMCENIQYISVENDKFKDVEECQVIPQVRVLADGRGGFTADFSEVLEPAIKNADGTRWKCDFEYFQDKWAEEKMEELYKNIVKPENPGQMIVASTPTGTSRWMEEFYRETVVPTLEPIKWDVSEDTLDALRYTAGTIEWKKEEPRWQMEYTAEIPEEECQHEWKSYMGLSEQFSYCIHCDEKRR